MLKEVISIHYFSTIGYYHYLETGFLLQLYYSQYTTHYTYRSTFNKFLIATISISYYIQ